MSVEPSDADDQWCSLQDYNAFIVRTAADSELEEEEIITITNKTENHFSPYQSSQGHIKLYTSVFLAASTKC
jgi:hypothetical protein